jgi:hypothetical protein
LKQGTLRGILSFAERISDEHYQCKEQHIPKTANQINQSEKDTEGNSGNSTPVTFPYFSPGHKGNPPLFHSTFEAWGLCEVSNVYGHICNRNPGCLLHEIMHLALYLRSKQGQRMLAVYHRTDHNLKTRL